jgi:hypothetical protein
MLSEWSCTLSNRLFRYPRLKAGDYGYYGRPAPPHRFRATIGAPLCAQCASGLLYATALHLLHDN